MPCAYNLLIFLIRLLATWFVVDQIWFNNNIRGQKIPYGARIYRPRIIDHITDQLQTIISYRLTVKKINVL